MASLTVFGTVRSLSLWVCLRACVPHGVCLSMWPLFQQSNVGGTLNFGLTYTIVASKFSVSHCAMLTLTHSMILSILDFCFLIDGESMHFKEFNNFIF